MRSRSHLTRSVTRNHGARTPFASTKAAKVAAVLPDGVRDRSFWLSPPCLLGMSRKDQSRVAHQRRHDEDHGGGQGEGRLVVSRLPHRRMQTNWSGGTPTDRGVLTSQPSPSSIGTSPDTSAIARQHGHIAGHRPHADKRECADWARRGSAARGRPRGKRLPLESARRLEPAN
jgi:hypothetical protein